jgi:cytochrome P450
MQEEQFKHSAKFLPERWLKDNTDPECPRAKDAHPFTYLPFGFGSRMCIGRRFAELEIEVLVARMVRTFNLEWHHKDLKFKSITINVPEGPLKLRLIDID